MTRPEKPTTLHGYAHADGLLTPRRVCDCGVELGPADGLYIACASCRSALAAPDPRFTGREHRGERGPR